MPSNKPQLLPFKLRVGVIMGGRSIEREVSFNSGRTICDHLDTVKYECVPLFQNTDGQLYILPWHFLHRGKIADFVDRLEDEAEKISWDDLKLHIDFVYIAVHGRYAEDGTLQGLLDVLNIAYLGAKVRGSALGMNKVIQKQLLKIAGIAVPQGVNIYPAQQVRLSHKSEQQKLQDQLNEVGINFPIIVKPAHEGSSIGMSVVGTLSELIDAIEFAGTCNKEKRQAVLVEEKIEGREFTFVGIQTKDGPWKSLPLTEVIIEDGTQFYDYEQKYMPGRATKITPADFDTQLRQKIEEVCLNVARVLEFVTLTRIDGFVKNDASIVIIDPNSLSGMGPSSFVFHQAAVAGMNHTQFINHHIETELHQLQSSGFIMPAGYITDLKRSESDVDAKIRIGVLLAGDSNEREVSLDSGRNVCYKLSPEKYEVTPLFVDQKVELYELTAEQLIKNGTHEIVPTLRAEQKISWSKLPEKFDFIFNTLHGGKGESGSVQGLLEMLGLPYNGSGVLTSSLCMDKYKTNQFLASHGFSVPKNLLVTRDFIERNQSEKGSWLAKQLSNNELSYPLICKPSDDGCSVMVTKCKNEKELFTALEHIFADGKRMALIEEYIDAMELTVGVLGNDKPLVLPASLTVSSDGDILSIEDKFLPGQGENQTPAPFDEYQQALVQHTMSEVYKTLECSGYARIDCFYQHKDQSPTNEDRVIVLEVNTLPGLTPATCLFHQAAEIGMRPMELIDRIVELGFELHGRKRTDHGVILDSDPHVILNLIQNPTESS